MSASSHICISRSRWKSRVADSGFLEPHRTAAHSMLPPRFLSHGGVGSGGGGSRTSASSVSSHNENESFSKSAEILSKYVPRLVLKQLQEHAVPHGLELTHELSCNMQVASLFADASGFTALTEKLATLPDGAELMCKAMNGFLTRIIECVHVHGGDIVSFAGDAVSAMFPLGGLDGTLSPGMSAAVLRASQCAMELHERINSFIAWQGEAPASPMTLSLHVGVGCGRATLLHLGRERCEFVAAGPAMEQSALAEPIAESGQTCVSPDAWAALSGCAQGWAVPGTEDAGRSFMILTAISTDGVASATNPQSGCGIASAEAPPHVHAPPLLQLSSLVPAKPPKWMWHRLC